MTEHESFRLYRLSEIIGNAKLGIKPIFPVSRTTWYRGINEGRYPRPVKLTEKTSAWRSDDISRLIEQLSEASVVPSK
jgi:hypothetical protein